MMGPQSNVTDDDCAKTERHREDNMTMEMGIGVAHLQARDCQGLPAITRSQERGMEYIFPQSTQKALTMMTP